LLVNDELARAIRTESAAALKFWFGVGAKVVWQWRKAFDIGQWGTEGSKRLHEQTTEKAAILIGWSIERQKSKLQMKRGWHLLA
jgi:hypothetical protein